MSDLISRKTLLEDLKKRFVNVNYHPDLGDIAVGMEQELHNEFLAFMIEDIEKQPTAYDVDKVVEQLEEEKTEYAEVAFDLIKNITLDATIEIVKGGGINGL